MHNSPQHGLMDQDFRAAGFDPVRLDRFSLETTAKDIGQLVSAAAAIPPGTPINIAFLGNETHDQRIHAAAVIRDGGFEPVPIISARRLKSRADLDDLLKRLELAAEPKRFMFVGGDPASPAGPFRDSLDLLAPGVLRMHSIHKVVIAGYPEGHPCISEDQLWAALLKKADILEILGCSYEITLQYCLNPDSVVTWIRRLREHGIDSPVRIGVPGPTHPERLIRFARQFGAAVPKGFGQRTGPTAEQAVNVSFEAFVNSVRKSLQDGQAEEVRLHLYPFGGVTQTLEWFERYTHIANE